MQLMAGEHGMDRRRGQTNDSCDPSGTQTPCAAQVHNPSFLGCLGPGRAVVRATGTVLETPDPFGPIAPPPDIRAVPGNAHRRGSMSDGPTSLDPFTQQQTTSRSQTSVTVHEKPPWRVGAVAAPHSL